MRSRFLRAGMAIVLLALGTQLYLPAEAQTPTPTATATATATPAPSGLGFSGAAPAPGAIGLLVTARSVHRADLANDFAAKGCAVGSIGVLTSGQWTLYIAGAPAIVNQAFPLTLGATAPFFVRCADGAPPPVTIDGGTKGVPFAAALASGIPATAVAYRFRVTGVDLTNVVFIGPLGSLPPCLTECRQAARVAFGSAWSALSTKVVGTNVASADGPAVGPSIFIDGAAPAGPYPFTITLPDGRSVQGTVNHVP